MRCTKWKFQSLGLETNLLLPKAPGSKTVSVTPNTKLYIYVGGAGCVEAGGYNGGGSSTRTSKKSHGVGGALLTFAPLKMMKVPAY